MNSATVCTSLCESHVSLVSYTRHGHWTTWIPISLSAPYAHKIASY